MIRTCLLCLMTLMLFGIMEITLAAPNPSMGVQPYCKSLSVLQMIDKVCPEGMLPPAFCDGNVFSMNCPCRGRGKVLCNTFGQVNPGMGVGVELTSNTTAVYGLVLQPSQPNCPTGFKMKVTYATGAFHDPQEEVFAEFDAWAWFTKPPYIIQYATLVYPYDAGPSPCAPYFVSLAYGNA